MPGPFLTVTVSESSHRGPMAGPLMILGHGILELALVVALLCGLAPLLQNEKMFIFISLIGGCILFWMAISMLKSLPTLRLKCDARQGSSRNLIVGGILFSLANPYWTIWWATIGLGYILHSVTFGVLGVAAFFIGHILADLCWYSLISFGVAKGRNFLTDSAYRKLIGGCASFLIVFACYFFYSGIVKLV